MIYSNSNMKQYLNDTKQSPAKVTYNLTKSGMKINQKELSQTDINLIQSQIMKDVGTMKV